MKKTKPFLRVILFVICGMIFNSQMQAQISCATTHSNVGQKSSDYIHVNTYPHVNNNSYCLKVYVHNVMEGDFSGGVSESVLNNQINILNSQFSGSGISFVWDGNILELNNDLIYNYEIVQASGGCAIVNFGPLNNYAHSDGIDLFFYGRTSMGYSVANGIADKAMVAFGPNQFGTGVLAHELGHALGLFHPFHGTIGYSPAGANNNNCENGYDGYSNHVAECPSGSNKYTAGDYVGDTVATTGDFQCNLNNCTATAVNDNTSIPLSCNGYMFPDPDITNFMMPGIANCDPSPCRDSFTPLQVRRMKYFLEDPQNVIPPLEIQNSILQSCIVDCGPSSCDMVADFTKNINDCVVNFNGINQGKSCPEYDYQWRVNGVLVSTSEDFTHDFQQSGTYNVEFTIRNPTSPLKMCRDSYSENITVSCIGQSDPTCPPNQIFVYDVECRDGAGGDASASWNVNASEVDHITWRYSIGPHSNLPLGTTTGNSSGQHAVNWNLPTPGMPIPGSWDNYNLVVKARAYLVDGTVCSEYIKVITLNCTSGGGGGQKLVIHPNPTTNKFTVQSEKGVSISEIKVRNIYGRLIKSINKNLDQEIDLSNEQSGIYFVKISFEDGSSETKKVVLKR